MNLYMWGIIISFIYIIYMEENNKKKWDSEKMKEYKKNWNEKHKEERKEYNKTWYEHNKERQKEYFRTEIICECGTKIHRCSKVNHSKTKKHIELMKNKNS